MQWCRVCHLWDGGNYPNQEIQTKRDHALLDEDLGEEGYIATM
jgi:hypothetical protein